MKIIVAVYPESQPTFATVQNNDKVGSFQPFAAQRIDVRFVES